MTVSFDFNFWTILLFIINFSLGLFIFLSDRNKAKNDALITLRDSLTSQTHALDVRLGRAEAEVKNGIKHTDIAAVYSRLDSVSQIVNTLDGRLGEISKQLSQINQKLMKD